MKNCKTLSDEKSAPIEITKADFLAFEKCRIGGRTNMFDSFTVECISGVSKEKQSVIRKEYAELLKKYETDIPSLKQELEVEERQCDECGNEIKRERPWKSESIGGSYCSMTCMSEAEESLEDDDDNE